MKKIILSLGFCLLTIFVFAQKQYNGQKFGSEVKLGQLTTANNVLKELGLADSSAMKITGKVLEVCPKKGCWMMLENPNGNPLRVTFKDYAFFMPKDIAGKTVVLDGIARKYITSLQLLRHYAEDAKKSKEEILSITEPKTEISFEASGVVILDK